MARLHRLKRRAALRGTTPASLFSGERHSNSMTRHYLDHASASPLRPSAFEAMLPYLRDHYADPGRLHAEGLTTRVALEVAREQVAGLLGVRPREIVFTSGGTEAANTAVFGAVSRAVDQSPERGAHIVASAIEHSCVGDSIESVVAQRAGVSSIVGCGWLSHSGHVQVSSPAGCRRSRARTSGWPKCSNW